MDSEIDNYLNDNKSLVIAPAGHGKTTLLTKCILRLQMSKNILILTHTHAGIASIKQKMSKEHIPLKNVCISTITGFAQHIAIILAWACLGKRKSKSGNTLSISLTS